MSHILKAPFISNLYWWAPVDLLRRLLFVVIIVALPGNPVSVIVQPGLFTIAKCSTGSSTTINYGLCDNICIP